MVNFFLENKEWLFSGLGLVVVGSIWRIISSKKSSDEEQVVYRSKSAIFGDIKTGDNSTNIQSPGNVTVRIENGKVQKSD